MNDNNKYDLCKMADLASEILSNSEIAYVSHKNLIKKIFESKSYLNVEFSIEDIIFRLTMIDSFYSTNMSKLNNGIEEIAEEILKVSNSNDDILKNKCDEFLLNPENESEIHNLFNNKYGFKKEEVINPNIPEDKYGNHAWSLISKYLYFLNNLQFPIFDVLAKESYNLIALKYSLIKIDEKFNIDYFCKIKNLNEYSNIKDYDKLDNLLWLIGKVKNGNYSLILHKDDYKKLLRELGILKYKKVKKIEQQDKRVDEKGVYKLKGKEYNVLTIDEQVFENLKEYDTSKIFSTKNNLKEFVQFAYDLNN